MAQTCFGERRIGGSIPGRMVRFFARIDVASILILLVLLLAALGAYFPQQSPAVASDPDRLAHWQQGVRARYGGLTPFLQTVGAFHWFRSPVVWLATGLLMFATAVCTVVRWRGTWRRALRRPACCSEATFDRAAHTARVAVSVEADPVAIVRESLGRFGFSVRSESEGSSIHVRGDRNRLAPLATLVTHAAVLALALGVVISVVWGWREELALGPGETVTVGSESAWRTGSGSQSQARYRLQVRNAGFAIRRYADGRVAGYEAEVVLSEGGPETLRGRIRLNQPLVYRGTAFTLQGFASHGEGYSVRLQAVRDPGYGLVIAAGFLMLLSLTVTFNFPHCCIYVRIEPEGVLRLAGRADRRAWGFAREFAALVREIGQWTGP